MDTLDTKKNAKKLNFFCEKCQFKTGNKTDYERHIMTLKHLKDTKMDTFGYNFNVKNVYTCECGKTYKYSQGLSKHKKTCTYVVKQEPKEEPDIVSEPQPNISENVIIEILKQNQDMKKENNEMKEMFMELLKENKEMRELMMEQNKQTLIIASKGTNINNNNCHNTNNKFNLQFFLNEQCKDALNIMDFVNDLQVKLTDLENVGKLGYSEGISKIFINGLKQLDVFKRPIHCSDLKREVLYVKDQNAWEKENDENKKIKNAIYHISNKNIQQIPKWVEANPNCKNSESRKNDQYLHIIGESMGSIEPSNLVKIIHNISKEVVIDKK
jgi:hypothetical protein